MHDRADDVTGTADLRYIGLAREMAELWIDFTAPPLRNLQTRSEKVPSCRTQRRSTIKGIQQPYQEEDRRWDSPIDLVAVNVMNLVEHATDQSKKESVCFDYEGRTKRSSDENRTWHTPG